MRRASLILVLLFSSGGPLWAEDVERPVIVLPGPESPRPQRAKAPPDPMAQDPAQAGPRFASPFRGPRRIDLRPLGRLPEARPAHRPDEQGVVDGRLSLFFGQARARRRVETGDISPAWLQLADRIEHHWQPSYDDIRDPRIAEVSGEWLADTLWQWIGGWYAETQRRRQDPFLRPDRVPGDDAGAAYASLLDLQRDCLGDGYGNKVVTLVEVRFDAQGASRARLLASSGHKRFDRRAMAGLKQALRHDLGDAAPPGPSRSIYALSAHYSILPPLPVVGFTFDLVPGGTVEFIYPFKKMLRSRAKLLAVYRESSARGASSNSSEPSLQVPPETR